MLLLFFGRRRTVTWAEPSPTRLETFDPVWFSPVPADATLTWNKVGFFGFLFGACANRAATTEERRCFDTATSEFLLSGFYPCKVMNMRLVDAWGFPKNNSPLGVSSCFISTLVGLKVFDGESVFFIFDSIFLFFSFFCICQRKKKDFFVSTLSNYLILTILFIFIS